MNKFDRIVDPENQWLKVPLKEIERLGLYDGRISGASKLRGNYAFLVVGTDDVVFQNAREADGLGEMKILDYVCSRASRVRNYEAFPQAEAPATEPEVVESATDEDDGSIPFETETEAA